MADFPTIENRLETLETFNKVVLESSTDCLKILDLEGRMQFMNFNGLCQMEIDDFGVFKGRFWWELWGAENETLVKEAIQTALDGTASHFTAYCPTAKGTPKWWSVTITAVGSPTNGIYQLLSVSRDITLQRKAEQEIQDLNQLLEEKVRIRTEELLEKNIQLERSNAELATFNHIASHDLQEPLRKIQIFSNLILEEQNEITATHPHFRRILDATKRMRNLIDALHQFSISKNGAIVFEPCDLNAIVADIQDYSQHAIDEKHAIIEVGPLPVIAGSKVLLTQLLLNILENALKYSKTEVTPHIRFSAAVVSSDLVQIPIKKSAAAFHVIKIEDNGIGFEDEYKNQIFEIFKRLHSKDAFLGTGIGLAICKTIVEKHHGWIDTTSAPNVGATFILYFPKA